MTCGAPAAFQKLNLVSVGVKPSHTKKIGAWKRLCTTIASHLLLVCLTRVYSDNNLFEGAKNMACVWAISPLFTPLDLFWSLPTPKGELPGT